MKTHDLVAAFLNAGQARGLAPSTIVWYRIILGRFAAHAQKLPRKPEPVEDFLSHVHVSARTRQDYYKALSAFFNWCEKRYGVVNPLKDLTPPKRSRILPRTLSSTEIGCLFLVRLSKRDRALIYLLLDTGVRIGEAMGLQPQDIGTDSIMVNGKTGPREAPISPEIRSQLIDIAGDVYVFEGPKGHLSTHTAYCINSIINAVTGEGCQKIHNYFPVAPGIHEKRIKTNFMSGNSQPQQMAVNSFQFRD